MKNFFTALTVFIRSVFSEPDGTGSLSRILTFLLSIVACGVLWKVIQHITQITDVQALMAWLGSLPLIVSALVLFFTAPYGVNKGTTSISDVINSFKNKDRDGRQ